MNLLSATLLREAAEGVAHIDDPRDRLAQHVGRLQGAIRSLCSKFVGEGAKPQPGCNFLTAVAGDARVLVEYEYEPGESAITSGPPERCREGQPASVAIIQALVNGSWCDPTDVFAAPLLERWAEQIADSEDEVARDQSEGAERDRYDDARDFARAA